MALRKGAGALLVGLGGFTTYRYQTLVQDCERQLPTTALHIFDTPKKDTKTPDNKQQRVVIIGAGVVGVCTAFKLAQLGHRVVVLEPHASRPGEECSHCAAGGMGRQNVVVDKNTWLGVLRSIAPPSLAKLFLGGCNKDDFKFFHIDWLSSLSDPFFLRWAFTFTKTSLMPSETQDKKQNEMLQFTNFAVQDMVKMLEDTRRGSPNKHMATASGYNARGLLQVSYDTPPVGALPSPHGALTYEPNRTLLNTDEVLNEEPSLKFQKVPPTWAKFEYEAKAASSGRFCKALAERCVKDPNLDVTFLYDTKVQGISTTLSSSTNQTRIDALKTNRGVISVEEDVHVVVAAGAWTPHVLALMDVFAPVYPLKGYALSVSAKEAMQLSRDNTCKKLSNADLPSRIVCDKYMYTTRLGDDEIRMTSIGEFSEWNTTPTTHVDAAFREEAKRQYPQLSPLIDTAKTYCGHRPFVSDGILLLGKCDSDTCQNLYVTCGPGSNGWKLAMGSGDVIARLVSGQTSEQIQDELGFDVEAFSPAGRVVKAPLFAKLCRARWNV